ncbi:MAG: acyl-CoA dehydrogenase domain-containing protein, partial [Neisseriaceae bacterium]
VEVAFKAALESYPIKVKVQMAIRKHQLPKLPVAQVMGKALELDIIDKAEYDKLMHSIKLTDEIMLVDDEFSPFELGKKNAHPLWS